MQVEPRPFTRRRILPIGEGRLGNETVSELIGVVRHRRINLAAVVINERGIAGVLDVLPYRLDDEHVRVDRRRAVFT